MQSEPKLYEVAYVLKAESEEEATRTLDIIKKYVESKSGMNLEESKPIRRRLAYPFKKEYEAFFGCVKFLIKPDEVAELESILRREVNFLRYMLTVSGIRSEKRSGHKKIRRIAEKTDMDIKEIDKKLEEILGQ